MNRVFKDRLIEAMETRNVKAVELAEKTGLSKARISQYMNGVYVPKSKGTHLIAKALNVEETWLMGVSDNMERIDRTVLTEEVYDRVKSITDYVNSVKDSEKINYNIKLSITTIADAELNNEQSAALYALIKTYLSNIKDGE